MYLYKMYYQLYQALSFYLNINNRKISSSKNANELHSCKNAKLRSKIFFFAVYATPSSISN